VVWCGGGGGFDMTDSNIRQDRDVLKDMPIPLLFVYNESCHTYKCVLSHDVHESYHIYNT